MSTRIIPPFAFSAIPLTLYQGGVALLANVLAPVMTEALIQEMSAVGSLLIIALSLNMLEATRERIRVGNMLPAILIPCAYLPIVESAVLIQKAPRRFDFRGV